MFECRVWVGFDFIGFGLLPLGFRVFGYPTSSLEMRNLLGNFPTFTLQLAVIIFRLPFKVKFVDQIGEKFYIKKVASVRVIIVFTDVSTAANIYLKASI